MLIDKNSPVHLYIQVADSIRRTITSGGFPEGSALPTEEDLCRLYGVSRYPMRQAMDMLVKEGYLRRVRGKGTFVTKPAEAEATLGKASARRKLIALVMPGMTEEFHIDLLRGFERAAGMGGYCAIVSVTTGARDEAEKIGRAVECGAAGAVILPQTPTELSADQLGRWAGAGVYLSFIDGNPGFDAADYVGCDNAGGAYTVAYHMKQNGFANAFFVSDALQAPSIRERLEGFKTGLRHFGIRLLNGESAEDGGEPDPAAMNPAGFAERLGLYRKYLPFAVFAGNDRTAAGVMEALREKGFTIGREVGVAGFGNTSVCETLQPPLTSVAQNGFFIGETAAKLAIEKMESGSRQVVRHILPTQLIARKSCGE